MEDAVAALLTQPNEQAAAGSVNISVPTLMRWQKEPDFRKALQQARRAALGQAITRLQQMSGAAVATLGKDDGGTDRPTIYQGSGRRSHHQPGGQSDRTRRY
jgi:hypothetical protein